jgi:hypothetical protein
MKTAGYRIRVEEGLRASFIEACRRKDVPAAQVIREFMRSYVEAAEAGNQLALPLEGRANDEPYVI